MSNLGYWEKWRSVPETAKKKITGGRLKNMTDINPVWRLQVLTDTFGPCGVGWKYEIDTLWTDEAGDEIVCNAQINLYYREGSIWSEPIPGVGGSKLLAKESGGNFVSDECYKMAVTDAISVACKALGIGADVYWQGGTKYDQIPPEPPPAGKGSAQTDKAGLIADRENKLRFFRASYKLSNEALVDMRKTLVDQRAIVDTPYKQMSNAEFDGMMHALTDLAVKTHGNPGRQDR